LVRRFIVGVFVWKIFFAFSVRQEVPMTSAPRGPARRSFLAGAAAALAPARLRAADLPIINVAVPPTDVSSVVLYADDLGYFKNAGLETRVTTLTSGPVITNAVLGGTIDIGAANVGSLIVARSRGIPIKIIASAGLADDANVNDVIMVRKDSAIQTGADIAGKTVGIVAVKTMQHAAVLLWIDRHGGDSKAAKFVEIPLPEMGAALEAGRVDVAVMGEPFTTMLHGNYRSLGYQWSEMKRPFLVFGFFATEQWLQSHAELAQKFAAVIRQGAAWANGHRKETAQMFARYAKLDPQIAATMARSTFGTTLEVSMIQPIVETMVRYGMMDKPIDAGELIWRPR
jgi:NitT/TauT family transport system substrate-binding protein